MKQLLILLAFLPFFCKAQTPIDQRNDGNLELVHAGKTFKQPAVRKENSPKKLKDDEVYKDDVQFKIGRSQISCDSAILLTNDNVLLAFHVKIAHPESFNIVGDMLNYNKEDNIALLTENITVTAQNGDLVGNSSSLKIDFYYEVYRVIDGAIEVKRKQ